MSENKEIPVTVEEIKVLREQISLMHDTLAHDVMTQAPLVQKVATLFIDKGLDRRWVEKLLAPLVDSEIEDDEVMLVAYVLEELDSLLSVKAEARSMDKIVKVVVGSTGIGKTSLIGKLGGRYRYLLDTSYSVAYINFDHQKVGAIEQLAHYSDAINIPLIALDRLLDERYDVVLLDTAGSMGDSNQELQELITLLKNDMDYHVEILLVLSATSKQKDLEQVFNAFKMFDISSFVFTKLDETSDLSDMLNFLIKQTIPLEYLSIGQAIPEDLLVASKEYILNKFMNE